MAKSCSLCGQGYGKARPHPSCEEGQSLFKAVRQARLKHERERGGMGTWNEWDDAWEAWQRHYMSKRKRNNRNKKRKKT